MMRTFVIILLSALTASGADWWVKQTATGNGSGSDTNNCMAIATVNSSWPASAGDTLHLCLTNITPLTVGGSGANGSPVTIRFEPNAKLEAGTVTSQFISVDGQSYITIDGGLNGMIDLTNNGTSSSFTYSNMVWGIYGAGSGANHIIVQNLAIRNIYQRTDKTLALPGSGICGPIYIIGSSDTYSNDVFGEGYCGVRQSYTPTVTSNLIITACMFTNLNHEIEIGCGGAVSPPILMNVTITHNIFQSGDSFETVGTNDLGLHRNPIFIFNESELSPGNGTTIGYVSNIVVAYNFIKQGYQPQSTTAGSGGMYLDVYNMEAIVHLRVYNNISVLTYPLAWSGGGGYAGGFGSDVLFANNTMVGWQTNSGWGGDYTFTIGGTNAYAYNNISISSKANWMTSVANTALTVNNANGAQLLSAVVSDYNVFNGAGSSGWVTDINNKNNSGSWDEHLFDSLAQFRTAYGSLLTANIEPHSTTTTALLDASYHPLANDTATVNGTNLTAWGITDDYAGNSRPATGNWTIGAYQTISTNAYFGGLNTRNGL